MNKSLRPAIIAGNWKMNKLSMDTMSFFYDLKPLIKEAKCDVVVCVPFTDIATAAVASKGAKCKLGAQNCHFEPKGAFTGEVSVDMLRDAQVEYVIIGHSERRQYFAETDETVNKKLKAALAGGLIPILCVGESLEQRENGETLALLESQIKKAYEGIDAKDAKKIVVAYEPIWAIGTGKTATADEAEEAIAHIRGVLASLYGDTAQNISILYGGSMNAKNAAELVAKPNIDGGLIGGASLVVDDFVTIINAASAQN
ncbi:triose-phosphate isomerase [Feifania hominis]|uniref:Triosephosphate isomerase n=1 Tax=Feifania hominis TaxID=2763660 RepID=A0A926DDH5_9FIRM|nr:triose-phosphate isomerase [Feifania hominis]MBC8536603.1 triose-phosphate isomerase [Feifania hominis]